MTRVMLLLAGVLLLGGCETKHHIIVEQTKPMEINVNLSGRLELVITDARKDIDQIAGEKPKREISAEDIGLPPSLLRPPATRPGAFRREPGQSVVLLADFRTPAPAPVASKEQLREAMKARRAQVMALLSAGTVGEAHTGVLAVRGALSPEQQKLVNAENTDRQEFYRLRAAEKGMKVEEVILAYYIARLRHVPQGSWYEKYNQEKKGWEWKRME